MFKDKWSYYHFFGPLGYMLLWFAIPDAIIVGATLIILVTAPVWWEIWDRYKIKNGSAITQDWNYIEKALFSSEGKFDPVDMKLGLLGVAVAFGLLAIWSIIF